MVVAHVRGHRTKAELLDEHAQDSWMHKIDARAKLVGVLLFVVVSALLTDQRLIFCSLAISAVFAAMSQIPGRHLLKAYMGALPFILAASLSVFLFAGLVRGVNMWARTSACVIPLLILASSTETFDLFSGLRRLKVPALITTLLLLTYKYILLMSDELARMSVARRARGFTTVRSLLDRYGLSVLSFTAGMVFVRSSARGERSYEGLKARGFQKRFNAWGSSQIAAAELSFMAFFFVVSAILAILQLEVVL